MSSWGTRSVGIHDIHRETREYILSISLGVIDGEAQPRAWRAVPLGIAELGLIHWYRVGLEGTPLTMPHGKETQRAWLVPVLPLDSSGRSRLYAAQEDVWFVDGGIQRLEGCTEAAVPCWFLPLPAPGLSFSLSFSSSLSSFLYSFLPPSPCPSRVSMHRVLSLSTLFH